MAEKGTTKPPEIHGQDLSSLLVFTGKTLYLFHFILVLVLLPIAPAKRDALLKVQAGAHKDKAIDLVYCASPPHRMLLAQPAWNSHDLS